MATIELMGIEAFGFHGVFDEEKRTGQTFVVDVRLTADVSKAIESDEVSNTVNYAVVADIAIKHMTGPSLNLIETLAQRIATECLTLDRVETVAVTVHKPQAPIPHAFRDVAVTVELTR